MMAKPYHFFTCTLTLVLYVVNVFYAITSGIFTSNGKVTERSGHKAYLVRVQVQINITTCKFEFQ